MLGSATKLQNERKIKLDGAVTGEVNFDGGKDVTISTKQNNIAVLEGKVITNPREGEETYHLNMYDLDFPEGFNADNCVCMAFGLNSFDDNTGGYSYDILSPRVLKDDFDPRVMVRSSFFRNILLGTVNDTSKIVITINTPYTEVKEISYRIVLMKIENKEENYILGDVNGDGVINEADLQMLKDYIEGKRALTIAQFKAADMNEDGGVDIIDLALLKRKLGIEE